jgi:hypothetical protein
MRWSTNTTTGVKAPNVRIPVPDPDPDPNLARDTTTTTGHAVATAVNRAASVLEARASSTACAPSRGAQPIATRAEKNRIVRTVDMIVVATMSMIISAPRTRGMGRRLRRGGGGGGITRSAM